MIYKIILALGTVVSYGFLVKYFYQGLHSVSHPAGVISTAVVMLLTELLMLAVVLVRGKPNWFPVVALFVFYGFLMLTIYGFYRDGYGLALAFFSFAFRIASVFMSKYEPNTADQYLISHVYLFMLTIIPIALGSKYIVKLLPSLKAQFPPGELEINTNMFNASEAILIWAIFYFSISAVWNLWTDSLVVKNNIITCCKV